MLDRKRPGICGPLQRRARAKRDKTLQRDLADEPVAVTDKITLRLIGGDQLLDGGLWCLRTVNRKIIADNT